MVPHLSFIKFGTELTAQFYAQLKFSLKPQEVGWSERQMIRKQSCSFPFLQRFAGCRMNLLQMQLGLPAPILSAASPCTFPCWPRYTSTGCQLASLAGMTHLSQMLWEMGLVTSKGNSGTGRRKPSPEESTGHLYTRRHVFIVFKLSQSSYQTN